MESWGVYTDSYVEEQRRERAEIARRYVEARLASAEGRVEEARGVTRGYLDELTDLGAEVLTVQGQISALLGDLRENPDQILMVYENSFDLPADRRAIEDLAERVLRVLPDTQERSSFAAKWESLQEKLEDRLPEKERMLRRDLASLERASAYLSDVLTVANGAVKSLASPRSASEGNLTAYARAVAFEKEFGENPIPPIEQHVPLAKLPQS
jgi:hypothetical protein